MVIVKTGKRFGQTTQEAWFVESYDKVPPSNRTIFYQAHSVPKNDVYEVEEFHTLAIDLHQPEKTIHSGISRTFKYHIRKAEKLNITCRLLDFQNPDDRAAYHQSYNAFAKRKEIFKIPHWRLNALIQSGALCITIIEHNSTPITYHAYVHDKNRARLITSHTTVQVVFNENEVSFCNKYHHWSDIQFFKKEGFKWYDFGGISKDVASGRNYFKKSFGGEHQVFYHFITFAGLVKLWVKLRNIV